MMAPKDVNNDKKEKPPACKHSFLQGGGYELYYLFRKRHQKLGGHLFQLL